MKDNLGYTQDLFILPFDHRGSYKRKVFGIEGRDPNKEELEQMKEYKHVIYEAFKKAVSEGEPSKESAAILVDEEFGEKVLSDAAEEGYTVCMPVEKSGQEVLELEFGDEFGDHIKKFNPAIVKVLLRYNPGEDERANKNQRKVLKRLSDYCENNGHKFLIEMLTSATEQQLRAVGDDQKEFENKIRPNLVADSIAAFQEDDIEADIWKLEGMEDEAAYKKVVDQMKADGRDNVGLVVLGRGSDDAQVEKWLRAGAGIDGVIGFAVGRTIWLDSIKALQSGEMNKEDAIEAISKKYQKFYRIFQEAK